MTNTEMNLDQEQKTISKSRKSSSWIFDLLAIFGITAIGWFLIGYYVHYEYLDTGYQDWLYHAFRVRDIMQYGVSSWDHVWASGINHWRAFQYVEHIATALIVEIFGLSITKAMIWLSVIVFIGIRIISYIALRLLGINLWFSFFAIILSYASSQQWVAIKDFSLHIAFIAVPVIVFVWIKAVNDPRWVYLFAALSGASWSLHPVIGYSTTGMLIFLLFANDFQKKFQKTFYHRVNSRFKYFAICSAISYFGIYR